MPNQIINRRVILGAPSIPAATTSVLQKWYDSLSVKPSAGLWTDLKIMADGMDADGDWNEMDFASLTAALETDEQRLRPLKASSGDDMVAVGTVILDSSGARGVAGGVLNTKWCPSIDGQKFTLNSAFMGIYGDTIAAIPSVGCAFGSSNVADDSADQLHRQFTSTTASNNANTTINNYDGSTSSLSKTGLLNATKRYFASVKRTSSTQIVKYMSGQTSTINANNSFSMSNTDFAICGNWNGAGGFADSQVVDYIRFSVAGSSLIDSDRVAARLQTFFTSRGLTITNY